MTDGPVPWRYRTARTPSRRTFGPAVGKVAAAMGKPSMRWQQDVDDVALEVLDDGSWAYRVIIVHVQRQAGKTNLTGPVNVHRVLSKPGARCWLTAQRRQDARDTWLDVATALAASPLASLFDSRRSNGSEGIAARGGYYRVFAPSEDALHGKANECVTVDEPWAFDAAQGAALEQAIIPTFATTGGQLWLVSTAGTAASTWLRGYVERGRAAVEAGRTDTIAYFECSLDDDQAATVAAGLASDADPADRARALGLVLAVHPARTHTLRVDALEQAADTMEPHQFLRAFGNVWQATGAAGAIPAHEWASCYRTEWPAPTATGLALAFDVSIDRGDAAISAAWRDSPAGPLRVDTIDARPGTAWLVPRLRELQPRWRATAIGYDAVGASLDVADELARGGMGDELLRPLNGQTYAAACSSLLRGVHDRTLEHPGRPALDEAVSNAVTRTLGDGGLAWSRRSSAGSIAALVSATVAAWTFDHRPPPPRRAVVVSRRAPGAAPARAGR